MLHDAGMTLRACHGYHDFWGASMCTSLAPAMQIPMSAALMALSSQPAPSTSGSMQVANGVTDLSLEQRLVEQTMQNDVEEYFKSCEVRNICTCQVRWHA